MHGSVRRSRRGNSRQRDHPRNGEVLDRAALTTAVGAHPLFNGVRSVTLTGLEEEPTITRAGAVGKEHM